MGLYGKALACMVNPNRMRSYVVLKDHGLAYGRVPKAANSSIKRALYQLIDPSADRPIPGVGQDEFWRNLDRADLVTASALRRRYPEAFVFSFVRNPFARVSSCYFNKIVYRHRVPRLYRYQGFKQDMSFAAFVERIAQIEDDAIDIHACSQSCLLGMPKGVMPAFVGRMETMETDWQRLNGMLAGLGKPGLSNPKRLNRTKKERPSDAELFSDPALVRLVRQRYREDFEHFYPDVDGPIIHKR